ncbi:ribosome maturation factor RimP [Aliidiomarina taiwanensis]|uniref:Ribosome maturation factor RimP n=1 Tax=Aliidiomarina taiwanensis TaxID=946228 RepID=A0A432XAL6_9GAMM|nr:ribosome maturation factor RimP [Aliidiomarina taiwanensis]RUO44427.1 ribosome maturation factor RimP [Aliidiomarina taiwanensis]
MATLVERLTDIIEPAVAAAGFELLGVELVRAGHDTTLRLYIDHENGITVDDCALVSNQVGAVLDVEDPISVEYNLEVSSPGADRPLFKLAHYEQLLGEKISVQLQTPVSNRRKLTGELAAVEGETITFIVDGNPFPVAFSKIKKANLVPNFD